MNINKKEWNAFVQKLSKINKMAGDAVSKYIQLNGLDDVDALIAYATSVAEYYGTASASFAAMMYDTITELEGLILPAAELAMNPTYGDVAKAIQGTLKTSENAEEIGGSVERLVKMTGQDTLLNNALRDHAEYAWIPSGSTCPFCLTLAANGWQPMSKNALDGGHAEHIHSNCDCTYMIRHSKDTNVSGYDPAKYQRMYYNADGRSARDKINAMRREQYAENKEEINEQKRAAYAKRQELNDSDTE